MSFTLTAEPGDSIQATPLYLESEYSFNVTPTAVQSGFGRLGFTSIALGTLQLEVDIATRRILHLWGLCPRQRWKPAELGYPGAETAVVTVISPDLVPGVSIDAGGLDDWPVEFDERSGWFRAIRAGSGTQENLFLIGTDTAIALSGNNLKSVWIKPKFVD
ncbi:hypothetical protein ACFYO1_01805 [Nocardia sp. NPDC006044]|uniref:hypothetical protein n=1 Tax=Nocardia sp. NPDC006044 TaxID=3364306 RepID=UPI0036B633FE